MLLSSSNICLLILIFSSILIDFYQSTLCLITGFANLSLEYTLMKSYALVPNEVNVTKGVQLKSFSDLLYFGGIDASEAFHIEDLGSEYHIQSGSTLQYLDCRNNSVPTLVSTPAATSKFRLQNCVAMGKTYLVIVCSSNFKILSSTISVSYGNALMFQDLIGFNSENLIQIYDLGPPLVNSFCLSANRTSCSICKTGYVSPEIGCVEGTCDISLCVGCSESNHCGVCQNGYPSNSQGNCNQTANCNVYTTIYECSVCSGLYVLNNTNKQCYDPSCTDSNCLTCSSPSICTACNTGYYLNPADRACYLGTCATKNCKTCTNPLVCTKCLAGYKLNATDGLCYSSSCNAARCSSCLDPAVCLSCDSGNYLNSTDLQCYNSNCEDPNCVFCSTPKECLSCPYTMILKKKKCVDSACPVINCKTCDTGPAKLCIECNTNYTVSTGECFWSNCNVEGCSLCEEEGICSKCEPLFQLVNGKCFRLVRGPLCDVCSDQSGCFGYSFTSSVEIALSACQNSTECSVCINSQVCENCTPSLNLYNKICSKAECNRSANFEYDFVDDTLTALYYLDCDDVICQQCKDKSICDACPPNYVTDQGLCKSLSQSLPPISCLDDEFNSPEGCVLCSETFTNCKQCLPDGCTFCEVGIELTSDGTCKMSDFYIEEPIIECKVSNCLQCSISEYICDTCSPSYSLSRNECKKICNLCGCIECLSDTSCSICQNGYSLSDGKCSVVCTDELCETCSTPSQCSSCLAGELVDGVCKIIECISPCTDCNTFGQCLACAEGFILSSDKCISESCQVENCNICDEEGNCSDCSPGYSVNSEGQCIKFSLTCNPGEIESDGECIRCETGCLVCNSTFSCQKCYTSFTLIEGQCHFSKLENVKNEFTSNCTDLLCIFNGQRINNQCPQCQDPCIVSLQKIDTSLFEIKAAGVLFIVPEVMPKGLAITVSGSRLLIFSSSKTSSVVFFRLTDSYIASSTCELKPNEIYGLRKTAEFSSQTSELSVADVASTAITQVIAILSVILPSLLAIVQYSDFLRLYYYISKSHPSWYTFINDFLSDDTQIQEEFKRKEPEFYAFYGSVNGNILRYLTNFNKKWVVFAFCGLQLIMFACKSCYRFFGISSKIKINSFLGMKKVMRVLSKMIEAMLFANLFDIMGNIFILLKICYFDWRRVYNFHIPLQIFIFYNFLICFAKEASEELKELEERPVLLTAYERQQAVTKIISSTDSISIILGFIVCISFQKYQFVCFVVFLVFVVARLVVWILAWKISHERGMIFLILSEFFFVAFIIVLQFMNSSDSLTMLISNILYLSLNVFRILNVIHSIIIMATSGNFKEHILDINYQ